MKKQEKYHRLLAILCGGLVLVLGIGLIGGTEDRFSAVENRALQGWSTLNTVPVWSERFLATLSEICSDQFPLRGKWLSLCVQGGRLLGDGEHRQILFGKDGYLIPRGEHGDLSILTANAEALRTLEGTEKGVHLWILPNSRSVMQDCLPLWYPKEEQESDRIALSLSESFSLTRDALRLRAERGEQVWYRTDHHFTSLGAYECYCVLAESVGWEPAEEDFFYVQRVSESFQGSSHSSLGGEYPCRSDGIDLYRYEGDEDFLVENGETKTVVKGFYDRSKLEIKDQYQIFMGGNHGFLRITQPKTTIRPRYLVVKDSFANCMIPFLALHGDLDVVDPRYSTKPLSAYLNEAHYDGIFVIAGIDTLATDPSFRRVGE